MTSVGGAEVTGIVLAAGASRRFGHPLPKQLAPFRGQPLVRRAATTALGSRLAEVVVVLGHRADEIRRAVDDLGVRIIDNPDWDDGQSTSIKLGVAAVALTAGAAIFIPVDQPLLSTTLLDRLLETFERGARLVVPTHQGRRGAPVLFARALFPALEAISGDRGGRQIFSRFASELVELPVESAWPLIDVDSFAELERLEAEGATIAGPDSSA